MYILSPNWLDWPDFSFSYHSSFSPHHLSQPIIFSFLVREWHEGIQSSFKVIEHLWLWEVGEWFGTYQLQVPLRRNYRFALLALGIPSGFTSSWPILTLSFPQLGTSALVSILWFLSCCLMFESYLMTLSFLHENICSRMM